MDNEVAILKAAIAHLMDREFGSLRGAAREKVIAKVAGEIEVSPAMAAVMIDATDETVTNNTWDLI